MERRVAAALRARGSQTLAFPFAGCQSRNANGRVGPQFSSMAISEKLPEALSISEKLPAASQFRRNCLRPVNFGEIACGIINIGEIVCSLLRGAALFHEMR